MEFEITSVNRVTTRIAISIFDNKQKKIIATAVSCLAYDRASPRIIHATPLSYKSVNQLVIYSSLLPEINFCHSNRVG